MSDAPTRSRSPGTGESDGRWPWNSGAAESVAREPPDATRSTGAVPGRLGGLVAALRSVGRAVGDALTGDRWTPTDRVGTVVLSETARSFTVVRETAVVRDEVADANGDPGAVLSVRIRTRSVPDRLAPWVARAAAAVSRLATPLVAGRPGFRAKLSLTDRASGDVLGIYHWASARAARRHARSLERRLDGSAAVDSVSWHVREDVAPAAYLAPRTVDEGRRPDVPRDRGPGPRTAQFSRQNP